jgi:hypothetical protein
LTRHFNPSNPALVQLLDLVNCVPRSVEGRRGGGSTEKGFLRAFVERVVGVKVTRLLKVGRRRKDLEQFLKSNDVTIRRELKRASVQDDTLRLLKCVVTGGDVRAFERRGAYTIACVITRAVQ